MTFARNLIRDLVERRLWPLALLLVVAIVAIPLAFAGGDGASTGDDALALAPAATPADKLAVELLGPPSVRGREGAVVDPFRRRPKKNETTTTSSAQAGADASTGAAATPTEGAAPSPGSGSAPAAPTASASASRSVYRTTIRWGSDGSAKARRILRLTPLGSLDTSALLYLGVDDGGKHALFLLGLGATSIGDAKCPADDCRIISLARGDTQTVALQPPLGAALTQFELELVSIKRDELTTAARASKSRAKERSKGRDILRSLIQHAATAHAIGAFAYDRGKGVMVEAATGSKVDAP